MAKVSSDDTAAVSRDDGNHFDALLSKIYYAPALRGSFSGVHSLYDSAKILDPEIRIKHVRDFLQRQETYTDFQNVRRKHPRKVYKAGFVDAIWGMDLVFVQSLKQWNKNFQYILTVVDFESR